MATVADSKSMSRTSDWPIWKSRSAGVQDPALSKRSVSFHSTVNIYLLGTLLLHSILSTSINSGMGCCQHDRSLRWYRYGQSRCHQAKTCQFDWLRKIQGMYLTFDLKQNKLTPSMAPVAALTSIIFSWWDSSKPETESSTKKSENCESRNKSLFDTFDPAVLWLAEFKAPSRD